MEPPLSIGSLQRAYDRDDHRPSEVVETVIERASRDTRNAWISRVDDATLRKRASALDDQLAAGVDFRDRPLFGVPFAVKDNVDAAGLSTTAACPAFEYEPDDDATVVERIREAGGLLVGKTNMDQFATGLVGTRSPYGTCRNAVDSDYISGGSSSGSAVAVATGQVAFALGTDTGGSGRVPAACNGIVGQKPTRGVLSDAGVVPACRTLDCVSVFANTCWDGLLVERVAAGFDPEDPYSRREADDIDLSLDANPDSLVVGVPRDEQLDFLDDSEAPSLFERAVEDLASVAAETAVVDIEPFLEASNLLFEGPWVAERLHSTSELRETEPEALLPVLREVLESGERYDAADVFEAQYERRRLRRAVEERFEDIDVLAVPTVGTVYTTDEIEAEPIERNAALGRYTNFVNLLDLAAVAVPAGRRENGVPFGITLVGEAFADATLAGLGDALCRAADAAIGADGRPYDEYPDTEGV